MGAKRRIGGSTCSVMRPTAVDTVLRAVALCLCLCAGRAFLVVRPPVTTTVGQRTASRGEARAGLVQRRSSHQGQCLRASSVAERPSTARASSRWVMVSRSPVSMSDDGLQFERRSGTGVQTIVKDRVEEVTVEEQKEELDKEEWWRVILHNDEIHTFDYVTQSITRVVKKLTMKKAYEVTMETHKAGRATVTQAWKAKAEGYCLKLQQCGLTASIAPESKFDGKGDEDGEDGDDGDGGSDFI